MAETKRDPSVGKEWLAWYALQGDEPLECVAEYLDFASQSLGKLCAAKQEALTPDERKFLAGLHLMLIGLSSAATGDGGTEYRLTFKRKRGKPINRHDRALLGHKVAGWVEREVRAGKQQEQAVLEAVENFGLSRAEIFAWLKHRRIPADQLAERLGVPPAVAKLLEPFKRDKS